MELGELCGHVKISKAVIVSTLGAAAAAFCLATLLKRERTAPTTNTNIAILDGVELKTKAKCFRLHQQIDNRLNEIFQRIRQSEIKFKEDYNKIRNNKKWSAKQRQKEISKLENKLRSVSQKYNDEIQDVRQLEFQLRRHIQEQMNKIIRDLAQHNNYAAVLNKETADTIMVFYNVPQIEITNQIIANLDGATKDLTLDSLLKR